MIDLRSDTVTKPSVDMRQFMLEADVGDDVYKEDPTVNQLEEKIATMALKEAALFVPTGTQSNLLALLSHCERGDEYICGQDAHIYKYEGGGGAVLGSIQPQPIEFEKDATLELSKIEKKIKADDFHFAKTKLLCLENTHNGKVLPLSYIKQARKLTVKHSLKFHLDGARVFNATAALGVELSQITRYFDSVSVCLSKGLGAPVGSVLLGNKDFIQKAQRYRKMLGGGMRQSGILAAGGIYALDNNVKALENDHKNAKKLADALKDLQHVKVVSCDTNMVFVETKNTQLLLEYLKSKGILISGYGVLRIVMHCDICENDIDKIIEAFKGFDKKC